MKFKILTLVTLASTLAACSGNSPSDANFKKAIETALNNNSVYVPNCMQVNLDDQETKIYQQNTFLQALVQHGYVTATKTNSVDTNFDLGTPAPGYKFNIVDKYKTAFRGSGDYFCYGKVEVTKIKDYVLGKSPETGQKYATVTYDYKVIDKPDWLTNQLVQCSFGCSNIQLDLSGTDNKMDLIQGEKTWEPDTLF